jgi:hypothetical protein
MKKKLTIDLWATVISQKKDGRIEIIDNSAVIYNFDNKYLIRLENIEEVNTFKLDHMSFDTLVLRITTHSYEFELPYYIEFQDYKKEGNEYSIPNFKLKPIIKGFGELIKWLNENLPNFKLIWLDETKPIIDNSNLVDNWGINNA